MSSTPSHADHKVKSADGTKNNDKKHGRTGDNYNAPITGSAVGGHGNQTQITNHAKNSRPRPPRVPLDEFCQYYNISEANAARLKEMEFEPGMDLSPEKIKDQDWREVGIKPTAWSLIKDKNEQFLEDVGNRLQKWEAYYAPSDPVHKARAKK